MLPSGELSSLFSPNRWYFSAVLIKMSIENVTVGSEATPSAIQSKLMSREPSVVFSEKAPHPLSGNRRVVQKTEIVSSRQAVKCC